MLSNTKGNDVIVSISCTTYNQENYIEDAIKSFLMQITDFKFEILIHDDASTDNTANIVRLYAKQYPDIIVPIFQKENQYSKGINNFETHILPLARGKYIAFCEGDDYWTDPYKLQNQVAALEAHPECDICAHTATMVNAETKEEIGKVMPSNDDTIFDVKDVILGDGGFVATNSLMLRKGVFNNELRFRKQYIIDYSLQIMGSLRGGMLYLSKCMSAYRSASQASWTVRMKNNTERYVEHFRKLIGMLEILDEDTHGMYNDVILYKIRWQKFQMLLIQKKYKEIITGNYKEILKKYPLKERCKIYIKGMMPWISNLNEWRKKHVY